MNHALQVNRLRWHDQRQIVGQGTQLSQASQPAQLLTQHITLVAVSCMLQLYCFAHHVWM